MGRIIQVFVEQLPIAALYALVGVGFVVVYRSTKVLNFAQGILALIGGYFFFSIARHVSVGFWLQVVIALAASAVFGALLYLIMLRPLIGENALLLVMLTIALDTVLGALILLIWGGTTRFVHVPYKGSVHLPGGVRISTTSLGVLVIAVVLLVGFAIVLRYSRFGSAMRAAAENPLLASYRGVNVALISAIAWGIATVFAAIAGISYGATSGLSPSVGQVLGFAAFPAIVLGGIDSVAGALIGAVVLAEVQGFAIAYLGGSFSDLAGYLVLLLVLVVRPTGLLGSREVARL